MLDVDDSRILLALVDRRWERAAALIDRRAPVPDRFVDLCHTADVAAGLHALLEREGRLALLPAPLVESLEQIRRRLRRDNLLLVARAEQALRLLHEAGVVPVALKGLDLLHRVYARIDERTVDDVDLLVAPDQLTAALRALEAAGWQPPPEPRRTHYIRSSHHLPLRSPGLPIVEFELHWNLAQEERFSVDVQGLFDRARPLEIGGVPILRLEDHDLVAHLLLHHFTHYFDPRLKWALDLQAMTATPDFSWEVVARRLHAWGAGVASGMAVRHLRSLIPSTIPAAACDLLPVAAWRRVALFPFRSTHPLEYFRHTRRRAMQLYLAAALLERPSLLPRWTLRRALRDRETSSHPLDRPATPPRLSETDRSSRGGPT